MNLDCSTHLKSLVYRIHIKTYGFLFKKDIFCIGKITEQYITEYIMVLDMNVLDQKSIRELDIKVGGTRRASCYWQSWSRTSCGTWRWCSWQSKVQLDQRLAVKSSQSARWHHAKPH
jgi:hypothetical protein